eukprot:NODE_6083_length_1707_cov_6.543671.p1 GENE.NODE_6083_length_1707_cov_6.543671~~NODE_6083_length_1707_cov_6.543671.p1  ORF type:complete len:485 (+),score=189.15 NODE_6083_length_1707_cov_6.543671:96-1550(+)
MAEAADSSAASAAGEAAPAASVAANTTEPSPAANASPSAPATAEAAGGSAAVDAAGGSAAPAAAAAAAPAAAAAATAATGIEAMGDAGDGVPPAVEGIAGPVGEAPTPIALPLLKFTAVGQPVLQVEGLDAISQLPGPVCSIAFTGDGHSGKSFLASKIVGEGAFPQDDSDVAVTEGIDVVVMPYYSGHLVVLDCEGGNNALSMSHSIVTVVAALFSSVLIFVTDGKASEAAVEALAGMLQERALIKCDGTGSISAQTLLFVVNQNRLRYGDDALEKILSARHGEERTEFRELISNTYAEDHRRFFTVPSDDKPGFAEKLSALVAAVHEAVQPTQMGRLWMTGAQIAQMLVRVEEELTKRGKVSLPRLHRHVILDSWLKPTVGQVLASRMDKLLENCSAEELKTQSVGSVAGKCTDCGSEEVNGWMDPDIDEFFCLECWRTFSPKVLKCAFCNSFQPWPCGRVEKVTKMWHCMDCLMQLDVELE